MSLLGRHNARPQVVVHALHKSASMFLFHFFKHLCHKKRIEFFSGNNDPPNDLEPGIIPPQAFCHCPVRTFQIDSDTPAVHRIFHVRDPRDMLVSEYFSFGWIHPTQDGNLDQRRKTIQEMPIDDYVLNQPEFSRWPVHEKFRPLLDRDLDPELDTVVKYETMVTRFREWADAAIRPFGFRVPAWVTAQLAWRYRNEFVPSQDPNGHKRRITPGDFREKLKPETIVQLNERFSEILDRFNYPK